MPTPIATGSAHTSPALVDHTRNTKSTNGNTVMEGFHTSRANWGPNPRSSAARSASVVSNSVVPPRRHASSAIPAMLRPLTNSAPIAMLTAVLPVSRYGSHSA